MRTRFFAVLSLGAATTLAAAAEGLDNDDWAIDVAGARVVRADAIELSADGGILGDRIVFDIRGKANGETGTLTLSCTAGRYAIAVLGVHPLTQLGATSDSPLVASLATTYCAKIDELPDASPMTPIAPQD
jgi:hypothetical protein